MNIGERVVVGVPATEAEVKTADAGAVLVHHDNFLVMRPELDIV